MKASLALASVLLACVALAAASHRFEGKNSRHYNRDQDNTGLNRDSGLEYIYDDELITNGNQNWHDCNKLKNLNKPECRNYVLRTNNNQLNFNNNNNNNNYNNGNNDNDNNNDRQYVRSKWNRFGRSSEESGSNENSDEQLYGRDNRITISGTNTLSRAVTEKLAVLNRIVVAGSTNMRDPLDLENIVVKPSQQHFVNFHDAQMRNLNTGSLQYFAVNPESDNVYLEYEFNNLNVNGQIKSNWEHLKNGQFNIDMKNVRSNVSARFHSHQATLVPAKFEYADVTVYDENNKETTKLDEAFENRYFNMLKHAISEEVHSTVHKGMLSQIKNEINTPLAQQISGNSGKLFDLKWKEGNVAMEIDNIGNEIASGHRNDQRIRSMSYTRLDANNYRLRFDVKLQGLQWTSDVNAIVDGRRAQAQNVNFNLNKVDIEVKLIKAINNNECRKVQTEVYLQGLRHDGLIKQLPSDVSQLVDQKLHHFIKHSLEAYMQQTVQHILCDNQKW
ncbi:homeobox protein 9-like [Adelges cooleyi]|uniref:homeobox protein 9-like n=1 Tax=Adelges cooleyi TaxID=133065 RepID=UPI00218057DF|nr:homeobox protein 9-like [Adelges cooleyi]